MIMPQKDNKPKIRLRYKIAVTLFIIGLGTLIRGIVIICRSENISGNMVLYGATLIIGIAGAIQVITNIEEGPI